MNNKTLNDFLNNGALNIEAIVTLYSSYIYTILKNCINNSEDIEELIGVIEQVFKDNPKSIEDYKNGKTKAMGFLVGQTMKKMKGKAAPDKVNSLIKQKLE